MYTINDIKIEYMHFYITYILLLEVLMTLKRIISLYTNFHDILSPLYTITVSINDIKKNIFIIY